MLAACLGSNTSVGILTSYHAVRPGTPVSLNSYKYTKYVIYSNITLSIVTLQKHTHTSQTLQYDTFEKRVIHPTKEKERKGPSLTPSAAMAEEDIAVQHLPRLPSEVLYTAPSDITRMEGPKKN